MDNETEVELLKSVIRLNKDVKTLYGLVAVACVAIVLIGAPALIELLLT